MVAGEEGRKGNEAGRTHRKRLEKHTRFNVFIVLVSGVILPVERRESCCLCVEDAVVGRLLVGLSCGGEGRKGWGRGRRLAASVVTSRVKSYTFGSRKMNASPRLHNDHLHRQKLRSHQI